MNPAEFERVDAVYVLVVDKEQQRVLMVQNEVYWTLPGGKRERGETLVEAAIRECREETGFEVNLGDMVSIQEKFFPEWGHHTLFFTFRAWINGGAMTTGQDEEVQQVAWKSFAEADELMPWYGGVARLLSAGVSYRFG